MQFDPFVAFRRQLRNELGLVFLQETLAGLNPPRASRLAGFDLIGLKLHYKTPEDLALRCAREIAGSKRPDTKLVYFDGNDEANIQWPEMLAICDLYWKKHILRERRDALRAYDGTTNLTHYAYGKKVVDAPPQAIDPRCLGRIRCGTSIGLDRKILDLGKHLEGDEPRPAHPARAYDVVLRADVPDNWMGRLRKPAVKSLESLGAEFQILLPKERVSADRYAGEMMQSRICVSPFGYGEICWRDFEAVAYGCLLMKPDMGHVESYPDIFQPFETYVPLKWDFSDLNDKIRTYLKKEPERLRIVANARRVLRDSQRPEFFVNIVDRLMAASSDDTSRN